MKTIVITSVLDVAAGLAAGSLDGFVFLMDNNKNGGSQRIGTDHLKTRAEVGDEIIWYVLPLEVEAFATIARIDVDRSFIEPVRKFFPDSDIAYWKGKVKKAPNDLPYSLYFLVGNVTVPVTTQNSPSLVSDFTVEKK